MMTKPPVRVRDLLAEAARGAAPSCAGMFGNLREATATAQGVKTNPIPRPASAADERDPRATHGFVPPGPDANTKPLRGSAAIDPLACGASLRGSSGIIGNVRECPAPRESGKTNPISSHAPGDAAPGERPELPPRQVAAAQLLAIGRSGRQVAAAVGVEEHTITRWRRAAAFRAELRRQQQAALAIEVARRRHVP